MAKEKSNDDVKDTRMVQAVGILLDRVDSAEIEPHRVQLQAASDTVYVYRIYGRNDKDYEGGVIEVR